MTNKIEEENPDLKEFAKTKKYLTKIEMTKELIPNPDSEALDLTKEPRINNDPGFAALEMGINNDKMVVREAWDIIINARDEKRDLLPEEKMKIKEADKIINREHNVGFFVENTENGKKFVAVNEKFAGIVKKYCGESRINKRNKEFPVSKEANVPEVQ